MLEVVGLGETEEKLYLALLSRPGTTQNEIAEVIQQPAGVIEDALASLEEMGLLVRVPEEEVRFMPTRPDVAIEGLIQRRQADLAEVRLYATRLFDEYRHGREESSIVELIELVRGRNAVHERSLQLQRAATSEVISLSKPPYASPTVINEVEPELLSRGISYRFIYNHEALAIPDLVAGLKRDIEAGEQARVLAQLPLKLLVADRQAGIVPLSSTKDEVDSALVVHSSWLLEALLFVFETLWERAVPLRSLTEDEQLEWSDGPTPDQLRMLELLAAGLTDEAIASHLEIGVRTLHRRLSSVMRLLGAENRFQVGYEIGKRGWA